MNSFMRRRLIPVLFDSPARTVSAAPPFSLGAIVTFEQAVPDGQIIKFVDPIYRELIREIEKDPNIIYQINHRKWEEIVAAAYDKAGFDQVILTSQSGDLGRDIIAIKMGPYSVKFIDQVKAYKPGHYRHSRRSKSTCGGVIYGTRRFKSDFHHHIHICPKN